MTPPIRMVSVPKEPTDEMIEAGKKAAWLIYDARARACWSAMLTAAPVREEGGAKSIWSDARSMFVRYAELFAMTDRYEEASVIADKAAREIEALAAREEAPDWTARTEAAWAENNREEAPAEASDYNKAATNDLLACCARLETDEAGFPNYADWPITLPAGHWRAIASALRARPQAREGAQPVAWMMRERDGHMWAYSCDAEDARLAQADGFQCRPLYTTPPAPEAEKMRVAVEALEGALPQLEVLHSIVSGKETRAVVWREITKGRKALAALQAEQKGGA